LNLRCQPPLFLESLFFFFFFSVEVLISFSVFFLGRFFCTSGKFARVFFVGRQGLFPYWIEDFLREVSFLGRNFRHPCDGRADLVRSSLYADVEIAPCYSSVVDNLFSSSKSSFFVVLNLGRGENFFPQFAFPRLF